MQEGKRALHALSPSTNASKMEEQHYSVLYPIRRDAAEASSRAKRETRRQPIDERSTPPRRRFVQKDHCARVVNPHFFALVQEGAGT